MVQFKSYSEEELPPQEEIDEAHNKMLYDFIQSSTGLRSMMLIGVRDMGTGTDAVEVTCGATSNDMFRASASILEAIIERTPESLKDRIEVKALRKLIDAIYAVAGDEPEAVVRIDEDDEAATKH